MLGLFDCFHKLPNSDMDYMYKYISSTCICHSVTFLHTCVYTWGKSVDNVICRNFCRVCTEFNSAELWGGWQCQTGNGHPSTMRPDLVMVELAFESQSTCLVPQTLSQSQQLAVTHHYFWKLMQTVTFSFHYFLINERTLPPP